jgi:murein DD-endopeptidase MepM/ murein hydrolase activator NlpD
MPHRPHLHHSLSRYPAYDHLRTAPVAGQRFATDYTLVHAGRQVRLGPVAFWIVVGTLVIMAAWSITTATYFAFRDDVLTRLVSREAQMQFGYEDRIAELRTQIDRLSSRQLLDQEQYEQKLDQVSRRQATLESRTATLGALADPTITGTIKPRPPLTAPPRSAPLKPVGDAGKAARDTRLDGASLDIGFVLAGVETSLDRIESRHRAYLKSMEDSYRARAQRMRGVLADLGIDTRKIAAAPKTASDGGTGGPFVAVLPPFSAVSFDRQVTSVKIARAEMEQLTHSLTGVPVRRPILGDGEVMSGFGVRIDPFLSRPAMHTGIDLRAEVGDPVQATAAGTVTVAGWSGGYGKMVEIDHGHGFVTRYGHLSEIDVKVGQQIRLGQSVGRVGTTGRSTGPHLHYETRIDGDAVDPHKFLNAANKLAELW